MFQEMWLFPREERLDLESRPVWYHVTWGVSRWVLQPGWPKSAELFWSFLEDTHVPESKLLCLNLQFFGWNSSLSQSGLPVQQHLRSNLQKHGTPQEIGSLALKLTFKYLHGKKNTFINSAASHQPLRWVNGAHTLRSRTALEPSKSFLA